MPRVTAACHPTPGICAHGPPHPTGHARQGGITDAHGHLCARRGWLPPSRQHTPRRSRRHQLAPRLRQGGMHDVAPHGGQSRHTMRLHRHLHSNLLELLHAASPASGRVCDTGAHPQRNRQPKKQAAVHVPSRNRAAASRRILAGKCARWLRLRPRQQMGRRMSHMSYHTHVLDFDRLQHATLVHARWAQSTPARAYAISTAARICKYIMHPSTCTSQFIFYPQSGLAFPPRVC